MSLRYWPPGYWGRADDVTALPLADFPAPAAGNAGLILTANDACFPAPGIQLVSSGTLWRPANGSAVLAMRSANPVTVQSTTGLVAETLGPFPGGLVRAGMSLKLAADVSLGALSTGYRIADLRIGNGAGRTIIKEVAYSTSTLSVWIETFSRIDVTSDASATHALNAAVGSNYNYYTSSNALTMDFSQPWSADIYLTSANETAKTITSATWASQVVTANCTGHTLAVGDKTTVAGVNISGYNGVVIVTTVPGANSFTYALATDPGAAGTGGTSSRISNVTLRSYVLTLFG